MILWSHAVTLRSHIILPGYACATGALDGCQGGPIQRSIAIDRPALTAAGVSRQRAGAVRIHGCAVSGYPTEARTAGTYRPSAVRVSLPLRV